MKIKVRRDYRLLRKAMYPPIEEQLDALWKGGAEEDAMRERILAIKQRFPKAKPPGKAS